MSGKFDKWKHRIMHLAVQASTWSKDPKHGVGCVITTADNHVITVNYNGLPKKASNIPNELRLASTVHAEINAIIDAQHDNRQGTIAYIYPFFPCSQCMAALITYGIKRIVAVEVPSDKWRFDVTQYLCEQSGIQLEYYYHD